jgi:hypothetical protein
VGDKPSDRQVATVSFNNEPPVTMARYATAKPVASLVLNPNWQSTTADQPFTTTVWESAEKKVVYEEAHDISLLRHYRYKVHPDLVVTGRGILFREYRDSSDGEWISDRRIADNIVHISFATNREEPWLGANQILIRLDLQADNLMTGDLISTRHMELIIAMRTITDTGHTEAQP